MPKQTFKEFFRLVIVRVNFDQLNFTARLPLW